MSDSALPPLGAAVPTGQQQPPYDQADQQAPATDASPVDQSPAADATAGADQAPAQSPAAPAPAGQVPAPAPAHGISSIEKVKAAVAEYLASKGAAVEAFLTPLLGQMNLPEDAAELDETLKHAAEFMLSLRSDGAKLVRLVDDVEHAA